MHFTFINIASIAGIASTVYIVSSASALIASSTAAGPAVATGIAYIA